MTQRANRILLPQSRRKQLEIKANKNINQYAAHLKLFYCLCDAVEEILSNESYVSYTTYREELEWNCTKIRF